MSSDPLIDPVGLVPLLDRPDVKILDATYGVPGFPASVTAALEAGRIGAAQFFNIDAVADLSSPYKHTLPSADDFARAVGALGVGNDDRVVIYDRTGIAFAAARAWWMFRVFGHDRVQILNGGLPAWAGAGLPLTTGPVEAPVPVNFHASFQPGLYAGFEQMQTGRDHVLDARAAPRFDAAHIPGSFNLPYEDLLDADGALRPAEAVAPLLAPHLGGDRLVTSCGSGVTACVLALALYRAGRADVAVYDGSWTEWADKNRLP